MNTVIDIEPGRQIVVSADMGTIRLSQWANRGSLGNELSVKQAIKLRTALLAAILEAEKAAASSA